MGVTGVARRGAHPAAAVREGTEHNDSFQEAMVDDASRVPERRQ